MNDKDKPQCIRKANRRIQCVLTWMLALGCICFWALLSVWGSVATTVETSTLNKVVERGQWELREGIRVRQEFLAKYSYLESIKILVTNLDPESACVLDVSLKEAGGKELCSKEIPIRHIRAGNYYEVSIGCPLQENKVYQLCFEARNVGEFVPRLVYVNQGEDVWEQTDLYVLDELQQGGLVIQYTYLDKNLKGYLNPGSAPVSFFKAGVAAVLAFLVFGFGFLYLWMERFREQVNRSCKLSAHGAGQLACILAWPALFLAAAWLGNAGDRTEPRQKLWAVLLTGSLLAGCGLSAYHKYLEEGRTLFCGLSEDVRTIWQKLRRQKWLLGTGALMLLPRLIQFGTLPRWKSGRYYARLAGGCGGFDFTFKSFFEGLQMAGPWSLSSAMVLAIGEFLDPYGVTGVLWVQLFLTAAAYGCLYALLQHDLLRLTERQAAMTALVIFSTPLFLGTFSYISLDTIVVCFFLFLLYAQYRKKYLTLAFWTFMLCLSKETGLVLAVGYLLVKAVTYYRYGSGSCKERLRDMCCEKANWALAVSCAGSLFHLYLVGGLSEWMDGAGSFGFSGSHLLALGKQIFVLNFAWLCLAAILGCLITAFGRRRKDSVSGSRNESFMLHAEAQDTLFGSLGMLLLYQCIYPADGSAVSQTVLAVGFTALAALIFWRTKGRTADGKGRRNWLPAGVCLLGLFWLQSFLDADILSARVFQSISTGKTAKTVAGENVDYYGDGYVNNYQYTWMDALLDEMLREAAYDADTTVILAGRQTAGIDINGQEGAFAYAWDVKKQKRVLTAQDLLGEKTAETGETDVSGTEDLLPIQVCTLSRLFGKLPWQISLAEQRSEWDSLKPRGLVFFFPGYEENAQRQLDKLRQIYEIGEKKTVRSLRGELVYYELQKRQLPKLTETDLRQNAFLIPSPEACRYRYADVGSFLEARTDICAGDEVTVRIEARIEGRTPAPYWMEQGEYTFVIGDERLVPGLAESLIGHTLGDQVVYDWVVPAGYGTDASLEGKTVTFHMEVTAHQGRSYVEDMTVPVEEEMLADYEALQGYIQ